MSENNEATSVEPSESTGLLDGVEAQDSSQEDSQKDTTKSEIEHRASDSIPAGEPKAKPEYLPDNFWNKEKNEADIEAMAKSWTDLRKMVSQGKHKAPPEGKYDLTAFGENADNLPMVPVFKDWAAKNGVSQAAFDELAGQLNEMGKEYAQAPEIDAAAERKALGPNAEAKINGMVSWARGLVNKGVWSKDDFEEFKIMGGTARGLSALVKIREAYEGRIPTESAPMEGMPTDAELQSMVGDPKYQSDPAYRQKVERLFNARYNQ